MAYEGRIECIPGLTAGTDLSSAQFRFGKISAGGVVVCNTQGEQADGVIQDAPAASGRAVSVAAPGQVSKVVAAGVINKGAKVQTTALGAAMTAAAAPTAASKDSNVGPFTLLAGDTMVIDVDNVGAATATWDAAAGSQTDTTAYPCADQDGLTAIATIDGGTAQTVTFSGAHTTAAAIAASMNAQLVGCSVAVSGGGHLVVTSDTEGTGSTVAMTAGTGGLTWNAAVAGTGDVVDITAVTATEIKTIIEGDTTATVTVNADGSFTVTSPTTGTTSELDFDSGNALAKTGLSVEVLTGAASGTRYSGKALEAAATAGDIISVLLESGIN